MPQAQDVKGWQLPEYISFRKGQKDLYQVISKNPHKGRYAIKLPTGYGKSWCACIAYATLKGMGIVDRALLIVPNDTQRSQYINGLREDLAYLAIDYRGIEKCDSQATWTIKKSLRNESDIFVCTVQSIAANPGWFQDLMGKNNWLVVADEFHHYAEENVWGTAIKSLSYVSILGMSATPFRGDNTRTIFSDTAFDVEISIEQAIKEKAIRGIEVYECEYDVTFSTAKNDTPKTVLLSELQSMKEDFNSLSEWEMRRQVRFHTKYVHSLLSQAINLWGVNESKSPGQNQILVFAITCKHAESIANALNQIAGEGMPKPFAQWVGTAQWEDDSGKPYGRSQDENNAIIQSFQRNEFPCLVQVDMAGEGFNNKRCSIAVMLDLVGDSPKKRQQIGRVTRINEKAPDLLASIFVSTDSPCLELLKSIEEQTKPEDKIIEDGDKKERSSGCGDFDFFIPDVVVIDASFHGVTKCYPYGNLENTVKAFKAQKPELKNLDDKAIAGVIESWLESKMLSDEKALSSEERRKQISEQVKRNAGILARSILRRRYGQSFPGSALGDVLKKIHGHYADKHGRQNSLTEDELMEKNEWLKALADELKNGGTPTWLNL